MELPIFGAKPVSTITITPVANGWIVKIPKLHNPKDQMKEMFSSIKNDEMPSVQISKDERIHVFKTFKEALAFLSLAVNEE